MSQRSERPMQVSDEVVVAVAPEAVFVGRDKRGRARWSTQCVVTVSGPGRRFAFDVRRIGVGRLLAPAAIATWEYTLEPVEGGSRFHELQARNIRRTLDRLKADLEV